MPTLQPEQRIAFRVGINFGDIIIDGDDMWGDGVNVAARLEALAEPGGICVSGRVQEDVQGKLDVVFEDAGERELKNIARPVRVYRVRVEGEGTAAAPLPLPDKPSIAVLPFENMSGDPEQEYFADGLTEDIITGLSRQPWFFVIARNSTFTYKGKAVDVREVARAAGCPLCPGRQRAQVGQYGSRHRSIDRRGAGNAFVGGAIRSRVARYLLAAGRYHQQRHRIDRAANPGG